ncbi:MULTISPECIES: hypothetical protein [Cronobacter]|uniref:hypothetical protein n=1 Tax=Cronobacter TaxID=413496 RepID=UPI000CFC463E|nr:MULTISPECIES: hypothetical protein [Cronobacter]
MMKLTGKPTTEQLAQILAKPVDPDERIRGRLRIELHRLVNQAALFGVEIPQPLPTEEEQAVAAGGILPHSLRLRWADVDLGGFTGPYSGEARRIHGGVYRGD